MLHNHIHIKFQNFRKYHKYYMITIKFILAMQISLKSMRTIDMVCHMRKYKREKNEITLKDDKRQFNKKRHLLYTQK